MKGPLFQQRQQLTNENYQILYFIQGDVTGDDIPDYVYLVGTRPDPTSVFYDNITLVVQDGRNGSVTSVSLRENAGYNPTLFLGDFTGDGVNDILINIDSGGSGGTTFNYVYSYLNNQPRLIFDFEQFNLAYQYTVVYQDNYKVEVTNTTLNLKFIIDISLRDPAYLSEIYDENGRLKQPITGFVNPLSGLYPIDFERDGIYELYAFQRIAGRYNADSLGYVETTLKWDGERFYPFRQVVAIFGAQTTSNGLNTRKKF